jgi:hypothetical protein
MLAFFEQIVKLFSHQHDLDVYIKDRNPKSAGDVERLIQEYTYKQMRGWL